MFTSGAKYFYWLAAAAIVGAVVFFVTVDAWPIGFIILMAVAVAATALGSLTTAFRDTDADAIRLITDEPEAHGELLTSPSPFPFLIAFGLGVAAIGLASNEIIPEVLGIVLVAVAGIEWTVQAWADRASADPAYNARVRSHLMNPIEFPVLGALAAGFVIWGFSRLMLTVPKEVATALFIVVGAVVFVGAAFLASRGRGATKGLVGAFLVIGAAFVLTAGVVGIAVGQRDFEQHGGEEDHGAETEGTEEGLVIRVAG